LPGYFQVGFSGPDLAIMQLFKDKHFKNRRFSGLKPHFQGQNHHRKPRGRLKKRLKKNNEYDTRTEHGQEKMNG